MRFLLAALILLVPAWTLQAADDDDLTKIRIEVTTLNGKPIDQASVIVRFVKGRSVTKLGKKIIKNWEVRTNREGYIDIPAIPRGEITIQIIAKGYQTVGERVEVNEPATTLKFQLKPPQAQYSSHQ